jgi:hypothetical protein
METTTSAPHNHMVPICSVTTRKLVLSSYHFVLLHFIHLWCLRNLVKKISGVLHVARETELLKWDSKTCFGKQNWGIF